MRVPSVFLIGATAFLLSGCGDTDVKSACFNNGEHKIMSDGRITRICDCRMKEARVENMSAEDQALLARLIDGKKPTETQAKRAADLSAKWANAGLACSALK